MDANNKGRSGEKLNDSIKVDSCPGLLLQVVNVINSFVKVLLKITFHISFVCC